MDGKWKSQFALPRFVFSGKEMKKIEKSAWQFPVVCYNTEVVRRGRQAKTEYGGIAQLGERLNGIQEVSGSIPLISTKLLDLESFGSGSFYAAFRTFWAIFQVLPNASFFVFRTDFRTKWKNFWWSIVITKWMIKVILFSGQIFLFDFESQVFSCKCLLFLIGYGEGSWPE